MSTVSDERKQICLLSCLLNCGVDELVIGLPFHTQEFDVVIARGMTEPYPVIIDFPHGQCFGAV